MRIFIFILIIVAFPVMFLADSCAASEPTGPIIKGLYIGMDSGEAQEVAIQIAQEICGNDIKKEITAYNDCTTFSVGCKSYILIDFDKQDKVFAIYIPIKFFGASDWTLEEFAQAFVNAYNVPRLDVKQEYRNLLGIKEILVTTYFYNDRKVGYNITMNDFKNAVLIKRITKTDDLELN